jgi:hypothetical protein
MHDLNPLNETAIPCVENRPDCKFVTIDPNVQPRKTCRHSGHRCTGSLPLGIWVFRGVFPCSNASSCRQQRQATSNSPLSCICRRSPTSVLFTCNRLGNTGLGQVGETAFARSTGWGRHERRWPVFGSELKLEILRRRHLIWCRHFLIMTAC